MAWARACSQPPRQLEGELGVSLMYLTLLQGALQGDRSAALHGMSWNGLYLQHTVLGRAGVFPAAGSCAGEIQFG